MTKNKTRETDASVDAFLAGVENETRKSDSYVLLEMFSRIAGESPRMWGTSLVGFGQYHYKYDSGREGDFFRLGFSPRKQALTVYIMPGFDQYEGLLDQLGKHKTGKSCLYINKLADVDLEVLQELAEASLEHMARKYPAAS